MKIPNSPQIEFYVLSAIVSSYHAFNVAMEKLSRKDFYILGHQIIFSACEKCYQKHEQVDAFIVGEMIGEDSSLKEMGGREYVHSLTHGAGNTYAIEGYIEELKNISIKRGLMQKAYQIIEMAEDEKALGTDLAEQAAREITSLFDNKEETAKSWQDIRSGDADTNPLLDEYEVRQETYKQMQAEGKEFIGLSTGIRALDKSLNGLNKGRLYILGARPSIGKTTVAQHIFTEAAKHGQVRMFCMEMTKKEMVDRLVCRESRVSFDKIQNGNLDAIEYQRIVQAVNNIDLNLTIDDQTSISINKICAIARRAKASEGLDLLVIDHLGLVKTTGKKENRQVEVAEISRSLKALAKDLDIPVIALSQMNRDSVKDGRTRAPVLADLRESGAIEQDADSVIMLHRPDLYDPLDKPGCMQLHIVKNRHGPVTRIDMSHDLSFFHLEDMLPIEKEMQNFNVPEENNSEFDEFTPG